MVWGWWGNPPGIRKKAEAEASAEPSSEAAAASRSSQTWAMLIKRVYEVDPLSCPQCGGAMQVVAFIEPPQGEVIEKILKHCGLPNCPYCTNHGIRVHPNCGV